MLMICWISICLNCLQGERVLPAEFTIMECSLLCLKQLITKHCCPQMLLPFSTFSSSRPPFMSLIDPWHPDCWSGLVLHRSVKTCQSVDCFKNRHAIINPLSKGFRTALLMVLVGGRGFTSRRNILKRITVSFCFNGTIKVASALSDLMFPQ